MSTQMSLKSRLELRFLIAVPAIAAFVFVPAGSLRFWQGWVFLVLWIIPTSITFAYFYKHDPEFVERRLQRQEEVREQRIIMKFFRPAVAVIFLLPGLDHRFGWSHSPLWLTILGQAGFLGGYLMTLWVVKVNRFAAATIQVEAGQPVISSGPYGVVRHPMYLGMSQLFLFTPLALGSYWTLPGFVLVVPVIVLRLLNEEKVLRQELSGYSEYCLRTRFRLVPFLW
jgi:protein-S-isoprenylcysteine O-methyltransferase Ste14